MSHYLEEEENETLKLTLCVLFSSLNYFSNYYFFCTLRMFPSALKEIKKLNLFKMEAKIGILLLNLKN